MMEYCAVLGALELDLSPLDAICHTQDMPYSFLVPGEGLISLWIQSTYSSHTHPRLGLNASKNNTLMK